MELKAQLVSLYLAKRMLKIGIKRSVSYFYDKNGDVIHKTSDGHYLRGSWLIGGGDVEDGKRIKEGLIPTYSVAELGIMLEKFDIRYYRDGDMWCCLLGENLQEGHGEFAKKEADSRTKMLIYIKENNINY